MAIIAMVLLTVVILTRLAEMKDDWYQQMRNSDVSVDNESDQGSNKHNNNNDITLPISW